MIIKFLMGSCKLQNELMPKDMCICMHMHKFFCVHVLLWRINLSKFLINVQDYLFIQKTFTPCPHYVKCCIQSWFSLMGQYCESEIKEDWIALVILETFVSLNVLFHSPGIAMYVSCSVASDSLRPRGLCPTRLICPWNSPGNSGIGCHFLLQGIA